MKKKNVKVEPTVHERVAWFKRYNEVTIQLRHANGVLAYILDIEDEVRVKRIGKTDFIRIKKVKPKRK